MREILLELEKIITRQSSSGFVGKINILKTKNSESLGYIFVNKDKIADFTFMGQKEKTGLDNFVYFLSKGLDVKFIIEPEVIEENSASPLYDKHQNLLEDLLSIHKKIESLQEFIPPMRTIVKLRKTTFKASCDLSFLEFMVAILVVKFREISKIVTESKYSELETFEALISLRRKGCINVIS